MESGDYLISLVEAAKTARIGRETLARMIRDEQVPGAVKSGRRYVIVRATFEKWLAGDVQPTHPPATRPLIVRRDAFSPN